MNDGGAESSARKVRVDEQVVRKVLEVNPALRRGRTTQQVKRALEEGASVATEISAAGAEPSPAPDAAAQLGDTVAFFLRGKTGELASARAELERRRLALDEEQQQLEARLREQVSSFLVLLDPKALEAHGATALARHHELLRALGVTAAELLQAARHARGRGGS